MLCRPAARSHIERGGRVASAGIYVFSPAGELLQPIPIPRDECTNCAFGGDDFRTLFVTAGGTLWAVRLNEPGRTVWNVTR